MQLWRPHHRLANPPRTWPIIVLVVLILPLAACPANGALVILTGTGYELTTPDGVSAVYNNTPGSFPDTAAPFSGTLTIDASFATNSTLTLSFVQKEAIGGFGASGGLRLALDTLMLNSTGQTWVNFRYQLFDFTDLSNVNVGTVTSHSQFAHFHPQSDPGATGNTKYTTTGMSVLQGLDNQPLIVLGGLLDSGQQLTLNNALLHERNYTDTNGNVVLRTFDLELTPTPAPVPASIILLASGGLAGATFGWLRRRRKETPPLLT